MNVIVKCYQTINKNAKQYYVFKLFLLINY